MRRTLVLGPAYLDRVVRVDGPLIDPGLGGPLDGSIEGTLTPGPGLRLVDPLDGSITIDLPGSWLGPTGTVRLARPLVKGAESWNRKIVASSCHDDLGGMGAGFAAALGGELVSVLGPETDPVSLAVSSRLADAGVVHRPIRVKDRPTDWTLLVTSGGFGDKLAVGFRGCHDGLARLGPIAATACDLRIVSSLPNRLAAEALRAPGALVRIFAPAMRNVSDRILKISEFVDFVDMMFLNRREWEAIDDPGPILATVSVLAITDGPRGSLVRTKAKDESRDEFQVNAFPRTRLPKDTNRAGEAYASTLLTTLLDHGWTPGPVAGPLIRLAAERASAAAALVLDRLDFGFPNAEEIDDALRLGRIE
ncbi:MAG: PfkB family carbohydrate kinase [Isosphaeraceae bacterium]